MITGVNGIVTQAQRAKEETEQEGELEKIKMAVLEAQIGDSGYQKLNPYNLQGTIDNQFEGRDVVVSMKEDGTFIVSCLDTLKDYIVSGNTVEEGINWNEVMKNAVAPKSQDEPRNEKVIGIGTDGNPVDMDFWQYTLSEDNTFGLNNEGKGPGYLGEITSEGEIQGNIPQYISVDNGKNYYKVTDLTRTFMRVVELKKMPTIPATANILRDTFYHCTGLIEVSNLPNNITELWGCFNGCTSIVTISNFPTKLNSMPYTFENCTSLKNVPKIPDKVTNMIGSFSYCTSLKTIYNLPNELNDMSYTFRGCTRLERIPIIPEKVTNMQETFYDCANLIAVEIIPESVENLIYTFVNCAKLSGEMEINANITDLKNASGMFARATTESGAKLKLKGSFPILTQVVSGTSNPNITL